MLNFTALDNVTKDANNQTAYQRFRFDLISTLEAVYRNVYVDSQGLPSNGIGFNLTDGNILGLVLKKFGVTNPTAINGIADIVSASVENHTNPQALLNAEMARLAGLTPPQAGRTNFLFSAGTPGLEEMRNVFDTAVLIYDNPDANIGPLGRVDNWLSGIPDSYERAILVSLSYNGVLADSVSLRAAIQNNDRAEAWFQIRYNSNKVGKHYLTGTLTAAETAPATATFAGGPFTQGEDRGIAKRRFIEADLFGLYKDRNNVTMDEAKSAYRMLQLHRDYILKYEAGYGLTPEGQLGSRGNMVAAASGLYPNVYSLRDDFNPAKPLILGDLVFQNPTNTQLLNRLVSDMDADLTNDKFLSTNLYLDPGRELPGKGETLGAINPDNNGALLSATPDVAVDEIFIGEGGNDYLFGGKGDDVLSGGTGYDSYVYRIGDGADLIADSDGQGRIVIYEADGKTISSVAAGAFTETAAGSNTWVNADGKLTLRHGTTWTLDIGGVSIDLGNDFASGKFDIILKAALPQPPSAPAMPVTTREIIGDFAPKEHHGELAVGTAPDSAWHITLREDGQSHTEYTYGADGAITGSYLVLDTYRYTYWLKDDLGNWIPGAAEPDRADILYGSAGNDRIASGGGNDTIHVGQGGDDLIETGDGNNTVSAGAGNDIIIGGINNDTINAGNGNNYIIAGDGTNSVTAGTGNDIIQTGGGRDVIQAGNGDNHIEAGAERDWLYAGTGKDTLIGGADADILSGGAGDDRLYADAQLDTAAAIAAGNIAGSGVNTQGDWLAGGTGDDILVGSKGKDVLTGGDGTDLLIAGAGDDDILGDHDWVATGLDWTVTDLANGTRYFQPIDNNTQPTVGGADVIHAGEGADRVWGDQGNDVIFGEGGADKLQGGSGNDTILGGTEDDWLYGEGNKGDTAGNDYLDGGAGNDHLYGGDGDDILTGGTGNDTLNGETGRDTYIYNKGDGIKIVYDIKGEGNKLHFGAGISGKDITLRLGSLMLDLGNGDEIHINGIQQRAPTQLELDAGIYQPGDVIDVLTGFDRNDVFNSSSISGFEFADGSTLTIDELLTKGFDLDGTNGNDTLLGTNTTDRMNGLSGDDTLDAGAGNDTLTGGLDNDLLIGGTDSDTYVFNRGDGRDTILEQGDLTGIDTLRLQGILPGEAMLARLSDGSLLVKLHGSTDQITVREQFSNPLNRIEQIVFGDGSVVDAQTLEALPVGVFTNGAGNDTFSTGAGDNVYHFNLGDGHDTIYELSGNDAIEFGAGITPDMIRLNCTGMGINGTMVTPPAYPDPDADLISYEDQRQVLNITIGSGGDAIDVMSGKSAVERFRFADGSEYTWQQLAARQGGITITDTNPDPYGTHTLDGLGASATFNGGAGSDILYGGSLNDTYLFKSGDGQDKVIDFGGMNEVAFGAGITASDIRWRWEQNNLGTRFVVEVGNAVDMNGRAADSLVIVNGEQGAVQSFRFADGTVLSFTEFIARQGGLPTAPAQAVAAQQEGEVVLGTGGNDVIWDSGERRSVFVGGGGNDILNTYEMQDLVFNQGDGQDTIQLTGYNSDTLVFGAGITPDNFNATLIERRGASGYWSNGVWNAATVYDLRIQYGTQGDTILADGVYMDNPYGAPAQIQRVKFNDGTVWSYADLAAHATHEIQVSDTIVNGTAYNDRIVATVGNSVLAGGAGNDTYVINQPGIYTINDTSGTQITGGGNSVELGWGSSIGYQLSLGSLRVDFDNGATIHINTFDPNDVWAPSTISNFKFADGVTLNYAQLLARGFDFNGTTGNDTISGTNTVDRIYGLNGDDVLLGGDNIAPAFDGARVDSVEEDGTIASATVAAGANSYHLYGTISAANSFGGDDRDFYKLTNVAAGTVLSAATFSQFDTMMGLYDAAGNLLSSNDDASGVAGSHNSLDSAFQYTVSASGDYYLAVSSFDANIPLDPFAASTSNSGFAGHGNYIASVSFSGSYLSAPQSAVLDGGLGNDTLIGGIGNDSYVFRLGDGQDIITDHDTTAANLDTLDLTDALATDVTLIASGNDLVVNVGSGGDTVTIKNWLLAGDTSYRVENIVFSDGTRWDAATIEAMVRPVNTAPIVTADTAAVQEDAVVTATGNVLANDTDVDQGTVLTVANAGTMQGRYGSLILNTDGSYSYQLDNASTAVQGLMAGQVVTESFTYQATDGIASTAATLTVSITGTNDGPVAQNDSATVDEDSQLAINAAALLANDTDADVGDSLSMIGFDAITADGNMVTQDANGDFVLDIGSGYQSLAEGETVVDRFTYTIADAAGEVSTATVDVTIAGVNDAPIVATVVDDQQADEDVAFSFTLPAGTFTDIDNGDVLSYSATMADGSPLPGWISFDTATQTFSGTPSNAEVGNLGIVVTATDSGGLSVSTAFNLSVANVNDAPEVTMQIADQLLAQGTPLNLALPAGMFTDQDLIHGDSLTYSATLADGTPLPTWLSIDSTTGSLSGTAGVGDPGAVSIAITATDLGGLSATAQFNLTVANVITGTIYNDTINGTSGADFIQSLAGNDVVNAGDGNDVIVGGAGSDVLAGGAGDDIFKISGTDAAYDRFQGDAGFDSIVGGDSNDTIRVNYFSGTSTVERIDGGLGSNVVAGSQYNDTIDMSGTELINIANIDGGVGNDVITGSAGNDIIIGGVGSDALAGGAGDDTFLINGIDVFYDRFQGDAGFDTIQGGAGDDVIRVNYFSGASTVERIDGGVGLNTIEGSQYNDTIDLAGTELLNIANIDGGIGNDVITGSSGNDTIIGGAGADVLAGGLGDDTFLINGTDTAYDRFQGGDGFDAVLGGSADDTIRVNYFSGASTVEQIDGGAGLNIIAGSQYNDTIDLDGTELINIANIDGGIGNDVITGSAGNDIIIGGAGSDVLAGGAGDDTFLVNGTDTAYDRFQGDAGYDVIQGDAGDDTFRVNYFSGASTVEKIDGGLGINVIAGSQYNDTLDLSGTELVNIANIDGGIGNDVITGSAGSDTIIGGVGSDVLSGGAGDDTFLVNGSDVSYDRFQGDSGYDAIQGGAQDDVIRVNYFSGASTVEKIDGGAGFNTIEGSQYNDTIDLTGTDLTNIAHIDGGIGNDVITGSIGNDVIIGGSGSDVLAGGAGDDIFQINGNDTAYDRFQGDAGFDAIQGGAGDDVIRVNYFAGASTVERIDGGAGLNVIAGSQYNDTMDLSGTELINIGKIDGGVGNDVVTGSVGNDILQGGLGSDRLLETSGNNILDGGDGADVLIGGAGNELFIGGTGNDTITTGNGADIIAFNRGDGMDTVNGGIGTDNTISLGKGINYADIALSKVNNNLILEVGAGEQITLTNWYNTAANYKSVIDLQVMADAMTAFDATSADPLLNQAVQNFDFTAIVNAFDQARGASTTFMHWSATNSLLTSHLSGSDTTALGGDLAHQYGTNGTLAGMNLIAAQTALNDPQFGATQTLRPLQGLQGGAVTL